jgi:2,4-dienoyl-CoA reductase-like NADH-dependent reductase (Old Yellow Enzyme family)/thioredoxin reductase
MKFTHVLRPILINRTEVKNRIFRSAHGTYFGKGVINDKLIAYHEARAKSGVGLSTLEVTVVHPTSATNPGVFAWDDTVIPGFRALSGAVQRYGMKMFVQLWHGGHHWPGWDGIAWSASNIPSPWGPTPLAMDEEKIAEIINAFAAAAVRVREGGMDGVELHFGHGYLVHQFFSPYTNDRTDRYGGTLNKRMRFGREILAAVRAAVGADFPVGIRISDSNAPGGVTVAECTEIVRSYCGDGLLDFVNGSMGSYHSVASMLPAMQTPVGAMMPAAGPIVAGANNMRGHDTQGVVRMVAGRFQTLEEADQLIRQDEADMVAIVRAMVADPDLVKKTLEGRAEDVRPCIGCNQGCVGGIMGPAGQMGCVVNPAVGFERTLAEDLIVPALLARKVIIIGGGPAGMEAARLAALSGHQVTLFEAHSRLGGAVNLAAQAPNLRPIGDITLWLEREIYRLGVDVRLSSYAEPQDVLALQPDSVIVATGSSPRMDGWQAGTPGLPVTGTGQKHVYSSHDIFAVPAAALGRHAVVYDDVGHYEAVSVAEHLIRHGVAVTFITRHAQFAPGMAATARVEPALERLEAGEFTLVTRARLISINAASVDYAALAGERHHTVPADVVVLITKNVPMTELHDQLITGRNAPPSFALQLVGDALSPRDLQAAIADGHMAGRGIQ